ncbi:MAG: acetoacetate--CoA ligase [Deltaproteobacteria bacterium]|nr:acetoacetate--CoA ligase [Deltaproteobacteria bacterium]
MGKLLWQPDELRIKNSRMFRLMERINRDFDKNITDYHGLHRFSVENTKDFWAIVWDELGVIASKPYAKVVDDPKKMPGAQWFSGAELNFAENLLRFRDDRPALVFLGEDGQRLSLTHNELYDTVARLAKSLKALGVGPGDRVAGFVPNRPETVCAMLAATSLGAAWSSCSPDFGPKGVLDRFGQIRPKVLFAGDGYFFKGRRFDSLERVREVAQSLPTLEKIVVFATSDAAPDLSSVPRAVAWDDFLAGGPIPEMTFAQTPFMHPLYIMYSSGTTGLPKCMVQGAGGILLHHGKEHAFHTDIGPDDVVFYFTTCGWMMWNWLVSVLATGATVVLFDGNPFHPDPGVLWRMAESEKVTVFGTSAGYLTALAATGYVPKKACDLSSIKTLLSTGSPLSDEMFDWVYENVKADLQLASISGGTDLNGCFALGCPIKPVYAGELQCLGLGMDVEAWDENGKPVIGTQGELVCKTAFPSMPLYFWNDPDGQKYNAAYFDVYPGVWRHGDFVTVTVNGGVVMYGRSDATLNPGGVRIGTAEIYRVVDGFSEVADSVVVGQDHQNDVRVILFVKMAEGLTLTDDLKKRLAAAIRTNASPRHVPAKIIEVPDVPYTLNMKKVELAVKNIIENKPVKNRDALANPDALEFYKNLPELAD